MSRYSDWYSQGDSRGNTDSYDANLGRRRPSPIRSDQDFGGRYGDPDYGRYGQQDDDRPLTPADRAVMDRYEEQYGEQLDPDNFVGTPGNAEDSPPAGNNPYGNLNLTATQEADLQRQQAILANPDLEHMHDAARAAIQQIEANAGRDASTWETYVVDAVAKKMESYVEQKGLDADSWFAWYDYNINGMLDHVYNDWIVGAAQHNFDYTRTSGGLQSLALAAFSWLQNQDKTNSINPSSGGSRRAPGDPGGGGRRGGGGGGLSANDFDLDQLTEAVQEMWRGYLLTESDGARALAQKFIQAAVSNPDKTLDFKTFVLNAIRKTSRYKAIYKNKPDHLNENQFLQPYLNTANQILRPENADDVSIMGAQMGSDPTAFRGLINNQREVRNSSAYINGIEQRFSNLKEIFRG